MHLEGPRRIGLWGDDTFITECGLCPARPVLDTLTGCRTLGDVFEALDRDLVAQVEAGEKACADAGAHVPYLNEDGVLCSRCGLTLKARAS